MEIVWRIALSAALVIGALGCGGSSGRDGRQDARRRVEATIGPGGGTLASTDGALVVTVPTGALAEEAVVAIEPIDNDAPHGVGPAWRLEPSGVEFGVPVLLAFHPGDRGPGGLGVAWREGRDAWRGQPGQSVDSAAGSLTVETSHFSDWTLFEAMRLRASAAKVRTGGTVTLQVESCVGETDPETLLTSLVPTCAPLAEAIAGASGWAVNGVVGGNDAVGQLTGSGAEAVYTAPQSEPDSNPVAVSVDVDLAGGWAGKLVAPIQVEASECPLGICRLTCTTREEWNNMGVVGGATEAKFTLEYERTLVGTAQYVPTSGTITTSSWIEGCTVTMSPDSAPMGPEHGNLSISLVDDDYAGGGEVEFETTTTTSCPDAPPITDSGPTFAGWHIGHRPLVGPPYVIEGTETESILTYTWRCEVEG